MDDAFRPDSMPDAALAAAREAEALGRTRLDGLADLYAVAAAGCAPDAPQMAHAWLASYYLGLRNFEAAGGSIDAVLRGPATNATTGELIFVSAQMALYAADGNVDVSALEQMARAAQFAAPESIARIEQTVGAIYSRLDGYEARAIQHLGHAAKIGGVSYWAKGAHDRLFGVARGLVANHNYSLARAALEILSETPTSGATNVESDIAWMRERVDEVGPLLLEAAASVDAMGDAAFAAKFAQLAASSGDAEVERLALGALDDAWQFAQFPTQRDGTRVAESLIEHGFSAEANAFQLLLEVRGTATEQFAAKREIAYRIYNAGHGEEAQPRMLELAECGDEEIAGSARLLAAHTSLNGGRFDEAEALFARATAIEKSRSRGTYGIAEVAIARGDYGRALGIIGSEISRTQPDEYSAWVPASILARLMTDAAVLDRDTAHRALKLAKTLPRNGYSSAVDTAAAKLESGGPSL